MFLILRDYLYATPWQNLEVETLRRRILKIGARVRQTTRRIWIHFSSAFQADSETGSKSPLLHRISFHAFWNDEDTSSEPIACARASTPRDTMPENPFH